MRPFAANSPWNTTVENAPVDARSDELMRLGRERVGVVENDETETEVRTETRILDDPLYINTREWTVPVVDEQGGVRTRLVCRQSAIPENCGDGQFVDSLVVPADVDPLPQFDGWFTILDRNEGAGYDLWRARRGADGSLSYQFMRRWELNGPGFLEPDQVSARGSGLPLFAGLITPEEIQTGRIEHALAISVPGPAQRRYVQPASTTDGIGRLSSLPEGARIRLREGITLDTLEGRRDPRCATIEGRARLSDAERRRICVPYEFPERTNERAAEAIIAALRRYGAIVVGRARVPTLYAQLNADWDQVLRGEDGRLLRGDGRPLPADVARQPNQRTPLLRGSEVQGLRLSDFEVVRLPPIRNYPALDAIQAPPLLGTVAPQPEFTGRPRGATTVPQTTPGATAPATAPPPAQSPPQGTATAP